MRHSPEGDICGDQELLVAYLYEECDAAARRRVEEHLGECPACASEVTELRSVRGSLAGWTPPDASLGFRIGGPDRPAAAPGTRWSAWRWPLAQAAGVMLVLGAAAALANLEVRYGADGVVLRTGWSRPLAPAAVATPIGPSAGHVGNVNTGGSSAASQAPWRTEISVLEQRLRREFSAASAALRQEVTARSPAAGYAAGRIIPRAAPVMASDAELLRRVRELIEESERRQQRELAFRLAQLVRDVDSTRRADLMRIQQGFGQIEGQTGAAVAQQRELLNYLVRVSQRR